MKCQACKKETTQVEAIPWRRVKAGPHTQTANFCLTCANERKEGETGERLTYRMREIILGSRLASKGYFYP